MATCKDCLHYDICIFHLTGNENEKCKQFLNTADVAPKSEVAREIFAEIEEVFRLHTEGGYHLNGAWFPERLDLYTGDAIAELKKKYTEGEG